ncbi:MAG: MAPEG family protein [Lysobacteraceae bacterium]
MTPKITLLFASVHALLMLALAARVAFHRHSQKVGLGDGGDRRLMRKMRAHANFVEYVPVALLLLALLELSGLSATWLWALGGTLLLARVLHAIGLSLHSGYSFGRFWGTLLTWVVLATMAVVGVWLSLQ